MIPSFRPEGEPCTEGPLTSWHCLPDEPSVSLPEWATQDSGQDPLVPGLAMGLGGFLASSTSLGADS